MLGFYYNTDKIIRIEFVVDVSVIHCWSCSSTNHNPAHCHLHTLTPAKCIQRQRERERVPNDVYTASHNPFNVSACLCVMCVRHHQPNRHTHRQRQTNRQQQEASQSVAVMRPPVASGDIYRIQYDRTRYDSRVQRGLKS